MKKTNRSAKPNKQNTLFVRVFRWLFFTVLFIFLLLISLYFFVFPSIVKNDISQKNIVIVSSKLDSNSKNIYLAHISEDQSENNLYLINAESQVLVPGGYGEYPLQSVYQLLVIDKKDTQFIKSVYSELLGISVDEVLALNTPLDNISDSELSTFFFSSALKNISQFKFNSFDVIKLHYQVKDMSVLELASIKDIEKHYSDLSTISGDLYQYCSVAVVNATSQNGLARKIGKTVENTGALVVRFDDSEMKQERTQIYYADDPIDCSKMAEKVLGIFSEKPEILPLGKLKNEQQYRAKTVIIVGGSTLK